MRLILTNQQCWQENQVVPRGFTGRPSRPLHNLVLKVRGPARNASEKILVPPLLKANAPNVHTFTYFHN